MKNILLITLFFLSAQAGAYDLKKNPIYHSIKILNKHLNPEVAFNYSNIIAKYSRQYKLDPFLVASISRQESHIVLHTTREIENDEILYDEEEKSFYKKIEVTDFCMMQIHKSNVIKLNLDPEKLLADAEYCIHEGAKILAGFKYLEKEDENWWTRYNASSPEKREEYRSKVMKHYKKIQAKIPNLAQIRDTYLGYGEKVALNE